MITCGMIGLLIVACGSNNDPAADQRSDRTARRYFAYAPPFIPHEVVNPQCLDCHGVGMVVAGVKTPVTPHPQLLNCQQCHIRPDASAGVFRQNTFIGVNESFEVRHVQPAGPPFLPHRVFMRENCAVFHDDPGRKGVTQTTHPERLNCVQCHIEGHFSGS